MGVLPLQYMDGDTAESLGLTGEEEFSVVGLKAGISEKFASGKNLWVRATNAAGDVKEFEVVCRLDTPTEMDYYRHGGVLQYVLRGLLKG